MQPFSAMWAANRVTNPVNPYAALGNQFTNNINEDKGMDVFGLTRSMLVTDVEECL